MQCFGLTVLLLCICEAQSYLGSISAPPGLYSSPGQLTWCRVQHLHSLRTGNDHNPPLCLHLPRPKHALCFGNRGTIFPIILFFTSYMTSITSSILPLQLLSFLPMVIRLSSLVELILKGNFMPTSFYKSSSSFLSFKVFHSFPIWFSVLMPNKFNSCFMLAYFIFFLWFSQGSGST